MMTTQSKQHVAVLAVTALAALALTTMGGAAQGHKWTLEDVVRRLQGLEERVDRLEKRLNGLTRGDTRRPDLDRRGPVIEIIDPQDRAEVGMNVIVEGVIRVDDLHDLDGRWSEFIRF